MAPPSVSRNANPHANGLPPQVIGGAASSNGFSRPRHSPITLPQHPDQHRSERPVLLAVDHNSAKGAALRVAPNLADPLGPFEVGEHEDVEEFGAGSGAERVEAISESALMLTGTASGIRPRGMLGYLTDCPL